ncbi:ankyrin-1-like [Venturia canescens]|uniref:ankyrin-1-like n=1 Tax=Venturia canescens TaxID=32260 RepID=UPI001C9BF7CB|nr:ankyrin-1-like [Venturia canescens]
MAEKQETRVVVVTESSDWRYLTKSQLNTKLLLACTIRDVRTAERAIMYGANVNCRRSDYMTPLHIAAEHGDIELIRLLSKSRNLDPEVKTMHGLTSMHIAALLDHTRVMYELLKIGSSTDCTDNLDRYPLHYAALHSNFECARYLIRAGSPIHVYDVFQESPLHISVLKTKNIPMIKLFAAQRLRRSPFTSRDAQCLLFEAILGARDESHIKIISMILHYAGDVINVPDPIGWRTPLHIVAMTGYFELAEYLMDRGADLEAKNRAGQTPMQVALNCKNYNIVRLMQDRMKSMGDNLSEVS